jgi:hypothetical protein
MLIRVEKPAMSLALDLAADTLVRPGRAVESNPGRPRPCRRRPRTAHLLEEERP